MFWKVNLRICRALCFHLKLCIWRDRVLIHLKNPHASQKKSQKKGKNVATARFRVALPASESKMIPQKRQLEILSFTLAMHAAKRSLKPHIRVSAALLAVVVALVQISIPSFERNVSDIRLFS